MLNINQILKNTPRDRLWRSQFVLLSSLQFKPVSFDSDTQSLKHPQFIVRTQSRVGSPMPRYERGKVYKTTVAAIDNRLPVSKGPVLVSCSCPDFKFVWEVALNKQGAAIIQYSNGALPEIRNPLMIPGACKHLAAFMIYLKHKGM